MTSSGLEQLFSQNNYKALLKGDLALLCHSASVNRNLELAPSMFLEHGVGLKKLFGPQHGLVCDVQDNMIESGHNTHPYFNLPVYSLYSETRSPSDEMLQGIDTLFIDLQDVGTRIYTYIYTMTLCLEACAKNNVKVVVLDRPNPIGGIQIEGNILDLGYSSFVGRHPLPVRHAMTMGELAVWAKRFLELDVELTVVPMVGWKRSMSFEDTELPWVMPSPNLPTVEAAYPFVGTVLFEGTNISEGRGTTRSLEIVGHPGIEPFSFLRDVLNKKIAEYRLEGFILRPCLFLPTFQKHAGKSCGGYQIHVTDRQKFKPWRLCQLLCQAFYHHLGDQFEWKSPPYEYEFDKMPIDLINGNDTLKSWVENNGGVDQLDQIENEGQADFMNGREDALIYTS